MSTPQGEYARSVELEINDVTETLGTPAPKTITDTERRALLQQARRWRVSADVVALAHGTCDSQPASLVGLRFRFSYQPQSSNRLSSAELNISFQPEEDGGEFPAVKLFAPTSIRADATEASIRRDTRYGVSTSLPLVAVPVSAGISVDRGAEIAYAQDFRCEVIGEPWTSDEAYDEGCDVDNAVTWYLNEHKLRKEGIPRELRTVVVVGRGQSTIRAKIKAKVKTNWGLSLFGSLWPQTGPLVIRDSVVFGDQPPVGDFKKLSKEQLGAFVGLDRPFEVGTSNTTRGKVHELIDIRWSMVPALQRRGEAEAKGRAYDELESLLADQTDFFL